MDTLTPTPQPAPLPGPWVACRACRGSGNWKGRSGYPCNLCMGSGDGRVRNHVVPWVDSDGVLRGAKRAGNGHDTDTDDSDDMPMPVVVTPAQKTAAERLAETLAELAGNASVNEDQVREIIRSEFSDAGNSLADLVTATKAELDTILADHPRRLEVVYKEHTGEVPAMRHREFERILKLVGLNKHVFLCGPAGSGKTTVAKQVADALGMTFYLQGAMSGDHGILGFVDGYGKYHSTAWRKAFEHGGLLLCDECDGSAPEALLPVNPGLANGHMQFPDREEPVTRHPDFRVIIAANTYGKGGNRVYMRNQLDGAFLNRWLFVEFNYDEKLERMTAGDTPWTAHVQKVRATVERLKIRHIVSPRSSIEGNDLLTAGFDWKDVEDMALWQGLAREQIAQIRESL